MKRICCIAVLAAAMGPVGVVHADAGLSFSRAATTVGGCLPTCSPTSALSSLAGDSLETTTASSAWLADALDLRLSGLAGCAPALAADSNQPVPAKPGNEKVVRQLPPSPGSNVLFLTGILSAGLWQGVRKAKAAQWGHLPDWYSPSAPSQIGPTVAFDPELGFQIVAECVFEIPGDAKPILGFGTPREVHLPCKSQHFLLTQVPRGPPVA